MSLGRLRIAVATSDPALSDRVAEVAASAGHAVTLATGSPYDAMEAAFSRQVQVLVLDQQLQWIPAAEIADLVRTVGAAVAVVVVHRGELAAADDLLVIDPTQPGFDEALAKVLADAAERPVRREPTRRGRRAG